MDRTNGIVIGEVIDLADPENLGRVRVQYPHLDNVTSDWARLSSPMAGPDRGMFFRPEVGDEVLVAFVQREPRHPCVLGSLWSSPDPPPADDGDAAANNWRFFRSRSGHLIKLDDTDGSERIEIEDKDGSRRIVIDSSGSRILVECDSGDIEIASAAGNITITAAQTIEIKGDASVKVSAPSIEVKADADLTLESGGSLTIKGSIVQIN